MRRSGKVRFNRCCHNRIRTFALFAICPLLFVFIGCTIPIPYLGTRTEKPSKTILVVDSDDKPLTEYDLYVYRCTDPGSQLDKVYSYLNVDTSPFAIDNKTHIALKYAGSKRLASDFYVAYEPQPYWVACIRKTGYASRRWSLDERQGNPVKIALHEASSPGEDDCTTEISECTPCRSHEYYMYGIKRYRHPNCN